jgi:bifunctional UDP-N-acetylglucosamine pyrophosphorylase/glucosamine-1-phosphate N-acetyltransferase
MTVSAIILAAGEGARMRSSRPKPLHVLCGRPMLLYMLDALVEVHPTRTVIVVGHGAEQVTKRVQQESAAFGRIEFVEQTVQRGTGDAVAVGLSAFTDPDPDDTDLVLVLPGDQPLLSPATIARLVELHDRTGAAATVLTAVLDDPTGYGRVQRAKDGRVKRIIEHKDADDDQRAIAEINTGIYCFRRNVLGPALRRLTPDNAQGEYYLTDVLAVLGDAGYTVSALVLDDAAEANGVNDRSQLAAAEAVLRTRTNRRWLAAGVTMLDPSQTFIDASVELSRDVTLFPGTLLQGATVIGPGCEIGPDARLVDTVVGAGAIVENCVTRSAEIGDGAHLGAYSVLEPGDRVPAGVRTGPFYTPGRTG